MEDGTQRVFGFQCSVFSWWGLAWNGSVQGSGFRVQRRGIEGLRVLAAFLWSDLDGPTVREGMAPGERERSKRTAETPRAQRSRRDGGEGRMQSAEWRTGKRTAESAEVAEELWVDRVSGQRGGGFGVRGSGFRGRRGDPGDAVDG